MRILAIDPSLRATGFAIVENGRPPRAIHYGTIHNPPGLSPPQCLVRIHHEINKILSQFSPDCCAMEGVIFVQSHRTAITLGAARGVAILAAACANLPIHEYAPRRVKQAVVGRGAAQKTQVAFMVRALLELKETPAHDAADALAIALTHLQSTNNPSLQKTHRRP